MPHVIAWEAAAGMTRKNLDQCMYGAISKKPTTITWKTTATETDASHLELKCNCKSHGKVLLGLDEDGKFATTAAARYPPALSAMIAKEHVRHAEAVGIRLVQRGELTKPIFEDEEVIVQKKVRAPALGEAWRQRSRFREGFKWTWSWTEPSNIVEARTLAIAVQSLARNRRAWDKRVL